MMVGELRYETPSQACSHPADTQTPGSASEAKEKPSFETPPKHAVVNRRLSDVLNGMATPAATTLWILPQKI